MKLTLFPDDVTANIGQRNYKYTIRIKRESRKLVGYNSTKKLISIH